MEPIVRQYLVTALWSSLNPDTGEDLDEFSLDDFSGDAINKARKDCALFLDSVPDSILDKYDSSDIGHDFWLTRNHHGAGFWDGDYEDADGKLLTDIAHKFGEVNIYIGDDSELYFE